MIIVTGGAGFIGSNLVWTLNARGYKNIVIVDELDSSNKFRNLNHLFFEDLLTPEQFIQNLDDYKNAEVVFHQGANATTTEYDGAKMMRQNFEYSKALFTWCQQRQRRFIYASTAATYGDGDNGFVPGRHCEDPLNVYGFSKLIFDRYVEQKEKTSQVAGMRYFNVYGPMEGHKGRMASVPWHLMKQAKHEGKMRLFEGSEHFLRDFVHVDDVVKVNIFLMDNPDISGLFNVGTGCVRSFTDMGNILNQLIPSAQLKIIPFPEDLNGRYQKYTCADLTMLEKTGFKNKWITLEQGLTDYHHHFEKYQGYRPAPKLKATST